MENHFQEKKNGVSNLSELAIYPFNWELVALYKKSYIQAGDEWRA